MYSIWKRFLYAIYPERCPYCQDIIPYGKACCDGCSSKIERCSDKVKIFDDAENNITSYCLVPLKYVDIVKQAIWRYKFRGCKNYSVHFADEIMRILSDVDNNFNFDVITFVPMSKKRRLERGYNQSEVLAEELATRLKIEIMNVLSKVRENKIQHNLSYLERENNVKDVYTVENKELVKDKTILLCDDVLTTGNTLKECCKVLYEAEAKHVECIAIAHAGLH